MNKIYDYVMNKINYKLFPKYSEEDQKVFKNSFKLSWIELKHLINDDINYILEPFLPKVISKIRSMENEKSPRKKILILNEFFYLVEKIILFNECNKEINVDFLLHFISYCFIKAQPNNLISNIKFMQLYYQSLYNHNESDDNQLVQLNSAAEFIKNISYKDLFGITQEEFTNNCNNVIKNINHE